MSQKQTPGVTYDESGRAVAWSCTCTRDLDAQIIAFDKDCPLGHRADNPLDHLFDDLGGAR